MIFYFYFFETTYVPTVPGPNALESPKRSRLPWEQRSVPSSQRLRRQRRLQQQQQQRFCLLLGSRAAP